MPVIKCPKCGVGIRYEGTRTPKCPKCGSIITLKQEKASTGRAALDPDNFLIPVDSAKGKASATQQTTKIPMKKCKHCLSDIPDGAKVCPYCRRKQKGGAGKIVLSVFVAAIILLLIGGALSTEVNTTKLSRAARSKMKNSGKKDTQADQPQESTVGTETPQESTAEQEVTQEVAPEPETPRATPEPTKPAETEKPTKSSTEFDYENLHVKYTGHEIGQNMAGEQTLIVYFDFTNNSQENESFAYSFIVKAFQNGVELNPSWLYSNDICKNNGNEIQPGTTLPLGEDFVLGADRSDITLQVEPFISLHSNKLMDITLSLQ